MIVVCHSPTSCHLVVSYTPKLYTVHCNDGPSAIGVRFPANLSSSHAVAINTRPRLSDQTSVVRLARLRPLISRSRTPWRLPANLVNLARSRILLLPRPSPHRPSSPLPPHLQNPRRKRLINRKAMTMTKTRTLTNWTVRRHLIPRRYHP